MLMSMTTPTTITRVKRAAFAALFALGLSVPVLTAVTAVSTSPVEAGVLKKVKKGSKLVGKGAGWVEKKLANKGKIGKALSKGAGGIKKGSGKLAKGVGKVQKAGKKAFGKVCKGKCKTVAKSVKKVGKGLNYLKKQAEKKCRQFGRDSKACKVAMDAIEFASPI